MVDMTLAAQQRWAARVVPLLPKRSAILSSSSLGRFAAPASPALPIHVATAVALTTAWTSARKSVNDRRVRHIAARQATADTAGKPSETDAAPVAVSAAATIPKAPKSSPPPVFDATAQVGITQPFGYFDPLGLCPPADKFKFRRFRSAELKHGRVAMMASVGLVAQHFVRLPGGAFDEAPAGIFAVATVAGGGGFLVLSFVCLILELAILGQDPSKEVGDFGDPFGVGMYDEDMRNKELNNGRMAMFATAGILAAELATGKDAVEQLGL